jgi:hypothetical protein
VSGAFHPSADETMVLLSPSEKFWDLFKSSSEYLGRMPNPIDRWSTRVINDLAIELGATPRFPFGGPPYMPFLDWAKQSGRAWSSPLGMLVHDTMGMMISYRGALVFEHVIELPPNPSQRPCDTCVDQPCLTACPVNAITQENYDVSACHQYLDTTDGQTCMTGACRIRVSCPVSVAVKRDAAHNLLHMRAFKGEI